MKLERTTFESQHFLDYSSLIILPEIKDDDKNVYSSSSVSFYKYAQNYIDLNFVNQPDIILEQRSNFWFGPTLLISLSAITQNPELVSITLSVISNFLTDYFKGNKEQKIKISILIQESENQFSKIDYEGDKEGLKEVENLIDQLKK